MLRRQLLVLVLLLSCLAQARAQFDVPGLTPGPGLRTTKEKVAVRLVIGTSALQPGQQAVAAVVLDIAPGYHAQAHEAQEPNIPLVVTPADNPAVKFLQPVYPKGKLEHYPALGDLVVYSGRTIIYLPFVVSPSASPGPITLTAQVAYQYCDDKTCFPPESPDISAQTSIVALGQSIAPNEPELFAAFDPTAFALAAAPRSAKIEVLGWKIELGADQPVLALVLALIAGVFLNAVPCVLPVLPLKAMGFYEASQHNRGRSFSLGVAFSAGLLAAFAALGVLVFFAGMAWGELFGNPWFLGAIVAVLVVMAIGTFGFFEMALPPGIYNLSPRHDTITGNFLFGILTAALSTPCTFGLLLGLLVWAAQRPPVMGVALVMTVGAGMALPYLLLSAFPEAARRFPRTGPWSDLVKQMMAFLLLLSAVYFARGLIERHIGTKVYWWILFGVVVAAAAWMVVRGNRIARSARPRIITAVLALLIVGPTFAFTWRITHPPIDWQPYSAAALDDARKTNRPVLVEFTAAWCGNCLALETTVFHDPAAAKAVKQSNTLALRADLTDKSAPGWALLKQVTAVGAIPVLAVYPPGSTEPITLSGIYSTSDFVSAVERGTAASPR